MQGEEMYLNLGSATVMIALATGLTRVTFRIGENEFIDVKESPQELMSLKSNAQPTDSRAISQTDMRS
jgi:hypothetical protein